VLQLTAQDPALHSAIPFAGLVHARRQAPQSVIDARTEVSHPSAARALQSAKPAAQMTRQTPREHTGVAFGPAAHAVPHAPQLRRSVRVLASHPLPGFPSQSAVPVAQPVTQRPAVHVAVIPVGAVQRIPQPPQCRRLVCVLTSQPLVATPSQSA
jgi:hypothetical protein